MIGLTNSTESDIENVENDVVEFSNHSPNFLDTDSRQSNSHSAI